VIFASLLGGLTGGGVVYGQIPTPSVQPAFEASPLIPVDVDISTAVTDAVAHVGPAVVTVINNLPPQRTLLSPSIERTASGSGVITSPNGYIVTNNHVVDGAESLEIIFADGTTMPVNLVGMDIYADLAVLHMDGEMPAAVNWGNSDALRMRTRFYQPPEMKLRSFSI